MPYNTIQDPAMARGFSILADAFAPNAEREINADLARHRRDGMVAQRQLDEQKLSQARDLQANQVMLQSILAGDPDMADPAVRADLMSTLAGVDGGLQYGPKFATGAATFMQPQFADEADLSNILLGTGVVGSYAQTPAGTKAGFAADLERQAAADAGAFARTEATNSNAVTREQMTIDAANARHADSLANALTQEQLRQDGSMARAIYQAENPTATGGKTPLDVSPADSEKLWEQIDARLVAEYPDATVIDPEVRAAIMPRVAQLYQQTRNAEAAIQQALGEIGLEQYGQDDSWWPTGDTQHLRVRKAAAAPAAAEKPGAGVAPSAAPGAFQEGQTATGPNGEKIVFRGGQWVPL